MILVKETVVTVGSEGQLELPEEIRTVLALDLPGTELVMALREDGVVELRRKEEAVPEDGWFWSEEWQRKEREADEDISAGRVTTVEDGDALIAHLKRATEG